MYMRNYIVDFPDGSSCRRREGVGRRCRCCLHAARCFHARLRCSGSGQDIAVAFFLFDFLFVHFFLAFLPLPICTFGQRSRRTLAWTRIGNNLLCLTAGMCVCRHAPTPMPATPRGWRMHNSYFRVARLVAASLFLPFWHFSNAFFPISFRAEHLNSLAVLVMKLFVSAPLSTGRNASRGMHQMEACREAAGTRFKL